MKLPVLLLAFAALSGSLIKGNQSMPSFNTTRFAKAGDVEGDEPTTGEDPTTGENPTTGEDPEPEEPEVQVDYYLCLSSENYHQRNANKFSYDEEHKVYQLLGFTLSSAQSFYIGGNDGSKWYQNNGDEYRVSDLSTLKYDLLFDPVHIFTTSKDGYEATNSHLTYKRYESAPAIVYLNGEELSLTRNEYQSAYELYYVSRIELNEGDVLSYGEESHTITAKGYYRVLFTPGKEVSGNEFCFDENGNYGSGENYTYHLYIEDATLYYISFETPLKTQATGEMITNDITGYLLDRDESKLTVETYKTPAFFVPEEDDEIYYSIYVKEGESFKKEGNDDLFAEYIKVTDRGWDNFTLSVTQDKLVLGNEEATSDYHGFYLASDHNNYLYNDDGEILLKDTYKFKKIESGEEYYEEDYEQYLLTLHVGKSGIKFYITDGEKKYRDGNSLVEIKNEGTYKILFSEKHVYGRDRHYRYSLENEKQEQKEVMISTAKEWNDFAIACNVSSSYSDDKAVYLTEDLDFANTEIIPISTFNGTLYGGYHALKNIDLKNTSSTSSIIGTLNKEGDVERLKVVNLKIDQEEKDHVAFIGSNYGYVGYVTLESGHLYGQRNVGLVGFNGRVAYDQGESTSSTETYQYGTIHGCKNKASIYGTYDVGGITGLNLGIIKDSYNQGNICGYNKKKNLTSLAIGGISGYGVGKIENSTNEGEVNSLNPAIYVGGVSGLCNGELYFVENKGNVSADRYVGGITGFYGSLSDNEEDLNKYFEGTSFEQFINQYIYGQEPKKEEEYKSAKSAYEYAFNQGNVNGEKVVGGITGTISNVTLTIKDCISSGNIEGKAGDNVGGIAGDLSTSTLTGSLSAGIIKGKNNVGGLVGNGGNIVNSFSSSSVEGKNNVGGLAGNGISVKHSISNTLIEATDLNATKGEIAGNLASYVESTDSFGEAAQYNYYLGSNGGINNKEYAGKDDNDAAKHLTSSQLLSKNVLSSYLDLNFDSEHWLAGDGEERYPVPAHLETIDDKNEYGDDQDRYQEMFNAHKDEFRNEARHDAKKTYIVTFKEWHEESGDLKDKDGNINYASYNTISTIRLYEGDNLRPADFVYAKEENGREVYRGKKATYFVTYEMPKEITDNTVIYAQYKEATSSIKSADGSVIVTGLFDLDTTVEVVKFGDGYVVQVYHDGKQIALDNVTIKVKKDLYPEATLYVNQSGNMKPMEAKDDGDYWKINYTSGEVIFGITKRQQTFDLKHLVIYSSCGVGGGFLLGIIVFAIIKGIKNHRRKRELTKAL